MMGRRRYQTTLLAAALLCAASVSHAQANRGITWNAAGVPRLVPQATLPDAEKSWMECSETATGGVDCLFVNPPQGRTIIDHNDDTLFGAPATDTIKTLLPLVISQEDDRVLGLGLDAAFRINYVALELDSFGAVTKTLPSTLDAVLTLGASGQIRHVGGHRASLINTITVDCNTFPYSTGGTKGYCAFRGGPAVSTTTTGDAELLATHDCIVKEVNVSAWTTGAVAEAVPATCTLSFGLRIGGADTAALCTVGTGLHQAAANCTPTASWTRGQQVAAWFSTSGAGCGTANHRPSAVLACY